MDSHGLAVGRRVLRERLARAAHRRRTGPPGPRAGRRLARPFGDPRGRRPRGREHRERLGADLPRAALAATCASGEWRGRCSAARRAGPEATSGRPRSRGSAGGYAVFYSALPRKKGSWLCLGVATAPAPEGPWRDAGRPLRCGRDGSIDPYPVRDERGRLYLLWKQDGNEFKRPTPIIAQRLSENGKRLFGRQTELITQRQAVGAATWSRPPTSYASGGWFYLLYSASPCCTRRLRLRGGSGALAAPCSGRWRKYPGNPILRGGSGWRCPGHVDARRRRDRG